MSTYFYLVVINVEWRIFDLDKEGVHAPRWTVDSDKVGCLYGACW